MTLRCNELRHPMSPTESIEFLIALPYGIESCSSCTRMDDPTRNMFIHLVKNLVGIGLLAFVTVGVGGETVIPAEAFDGGAVELGSLIVHVTFHRDNGRTIGPCLGDLCGRDPIGHHNNAVQAGSS